MEIHKIFFFLFIIFTSAISCHKDNSSKVSVESGKIKITENDTATYYYKIDEISYLTNEDTTTLEIIGIKTDSSEEKICISFNKVVNLTEKKYYLTSSISDELLNNITFAYEFSPSKVTYFGGNIEVVSYNQNDIFQAKLSFNPVKNNKVDSSTTIKGEVNLDFVDFDPSKIPNLPIRPGTLTINVDSEQVSLTCVALYIESLNKYIINGTSTNDNKNLVVEMSNVKLKINKEYPIGVPFDSASFVTATYSPNTSSTYWCDGKNNTSGKIKITKFTYETIQGYLNFTAYNKTTHKKLTLSKGIFYARLKK